MAVSTLLGGWRIVASRIVAASCRISGAATSAHGTWTGAASPASDQPSSGGGGAGSGCMVEIEQRGQLEQGGDPGPARGGRVTAHQQHRVEVRTAGAVDVDDRVVADVQDAVRPGLEVVHGALEDRRLRL